MSSVSQGAQNAQPLFEVSYFEPYYSKGLARWCPGIRPVRRAHTWRQLAASLTRFRPGPDDGDKTRLPSWSPAIYPADKTRAAEHVEAVSCLVLDIDTGGSIAESIARWSSWPAVIHSSFSYTPEVQKHRVVLPLARPIAVRWWARAWAWAAARDPRLDKACKDASRLYFLPALRSPDAPRVAHVVETDGGLLDLGDGSDLPETDAERVARRWRERGAVAVAPGSVASTIKARLKSDPEVRQRLGLALGGRVCGDGVEEIRCPACGRGSVWFPILPTKAGKAYCHHKKTCGYSGWLDELHAALSAAPVAA